ncbi:SGNH/GDSL hydrolase family protein [Streptomyces sp. NPDC048110]|uniref:SGNH/GDSL hydrolase family protein n=1 Tax=Streptomyces sp. NPDC048110 TaxID=3155483 RepID=UPI0033F56227
MALQLPTRGCLLFQGDSITASQRDPDDGAALGHGFVSRIARALASSHPQLRVVNRGVSGDRVSDLVRRWQEDCLALQPSVVSVLVGVNDTWRRFDRDDPTPVEAYERSYRNILTRSARQDSHLVLVEPFLVPFRDEQWAWREDLDQRIAAVRRLSREFDAPLLAADGLLNQAVHAHGGPAALTNDGVHLTEAGHVVLADAWLALADLS